jgi:hypothetical protein
MTSDVSDISFKSVACLDLNISLALLQTLSSSIAEAEYMPDGSAPPPLVLQNFSGTTVLYAIGVGGMDPSAEEFYEAEHGQSVPLPKNDLRVQRPPVSRILKLRFPEQLDWMDLDIPNVECVCPRMVPLNSDQTTIFGEYHNILVSTEMVPSGAKAIVLASPLKIRNTTRRRIEFSTDAKTVHLDLKRGGEGYIPTSNCKNQLRTIYFRHWAKDEEKNQLWPWIEITIKGDPNEIETTSTRSINTSRRISSEGITAAQRDGYREAYHTFDKNKDGTLCQNELPSAG